MMKRAAVVPVVPVCSEAPGPAARSQRRRPRGPASGRRRRRGGGACWDLRLFCLGCLYELVWLWPCFAAGAALTPGCRSRHARQRPLRRLAGAACLPVSVALSFGLPLDGFCCEMLASPHDARYESGAPNSLRLVGGIGCVRRRIKSLGFLCSRCRGTAAFCPVLRVAVLKTERARPVGII